MIRKTKAARQTQPSHDPVFWEGIPREEVIKECIYKRFETGYSDRTACGKVYEYLKQRFPAELNIYDSQSILASSDRINTLLPISDTVLTKRNLVCLEIICLARLHKTMRGIFGMSCLISLRILLADGPSPQMNVNFSLFSTRLV